MTIKLWQLVAVVAAMAFLVGLLGGRYVVPHKTAQEKAYGALVDAATSATGGKDAEQSEAAANVRAAVPAMEAYNADHPGQGYTGVSIAGLQATYDAGIRNVVLGWANHTTYCLQSSVGSATYHKAGPASDILSGSCSGQ
jgi:hypothetical protein